MYSVFKIRVLIISEKAIYLWAHIKAFIKHLIKFYAYIPPQKTQLTCNK